jgi:hypothetical protein
VNESIQLRPGSRKDPEEIDRGLTMLALSHGRSRLASRELKAQGYKVSESTLRVWKKLYEERYLEIQTKEAPRLRARLADGHENLVVRGMEIEGELLDRLTGNAQELKPGEIPAAVKNLALQQAIHTDKAQLYRNQPTQITEHRDIGEIIRALKDKGVEVVHGEATTEFPPAQNYAPEAVDAQVVEDPPAIPPDGPTLQEPPETEDTGSTEDAGVEVAE